MSKSNIMSRQKMMAMYSRCDPGLTESKKQKKQDTEIKV